MENLESRKQRELRVKKQSFDPKTFGMYFFRRNKKGKWTHRI